MHTSSGMKWRGLSLILLLYLAGIARAIPDPGAGSPAWLNYWSFGNTTSWLNDRGYPPISFTNLSASPLGNWTALVLDSTNTAWLQYKVVEADGTNNLMLDRGSVMLWFAPAWSSTNAGGSGPGQWGRLLEAGTYTTNASIGWWSLYVDPAGVNLYFAAQTNGSEAMYLSAPIAWTTNLWHLITLTYSATNSTLYLDGELATNGPGVTIWPGPTALTNGFFIGSDATGIAQARGLFDDLATYDFPLDANSIADMFGWSSFFYYFNPGNFANLVSAPSEPVYGSTFVAITGLGDLQQVSTNASGCVINSNLWITNVVATPGSNTMNLTFTIAGGSNGVPYDVFANSNLATASNTNYPWAWIGRGYHCSTYQLTNLPPTSAFLVLGHPTDSDLDGLTDAYELLVSKTNPANPDTDGDGMIDGWEVINGLDPNSNDAAQSGRRSNYGYDSGGWLLNLFGIRSKSLSFDAEGNVTQVAP